MILTIAVLFLSGAIAFGQGSSGDPNAERIHSSETERIHSFFISLNRDHGSEEANERSQGYLLGQAGLSGLSANAANAAAKEYAREMDALRTLHFKIIGGQQDQTIRHTEVRRLLERRNSIALTILEQLKKTLEPEKAAKLRNYLSSTSHSWR